MASPGCELGVVMVVNVAAFKWPVQGKTMLVVFKVFRMQGLVRI